MAVKRKYELPISQNLAVTHEVDKKVKSSTEIAKEYGFLPSMLLTYLNKWDSIEKMAKEERQTGMRKRIQGAKHSDIEKALFERFGDTTANHIRYLSC